MHRQIVAFPLLISVFAAGCFAPLDYAIHRSIDRSVDRAAEREAERRAERRREHDRAGDAIARQMLAGQSQMLVQVYTTMLFTLAFHSGGYAVGERGYARGEFTRWDIEGDGQPTGNWMERAYLFDDEEGNQWWKVKYFDADSEETIILEALLSADLTEVLRMRARLPGEAPREYPVAEGTTFVPPQKLSKQSVKGAMKGTAQVKVGAGTFTASHLVFGGPEGSHEWWLVDSVPGGHVRFAVRSSHESDEDGFDASNYVLSLSAFGRDAKSELGTE